MVEETKPHVHEWKLVPAKNGEGFKAQCVLCGYFMADNQSSEEENCLR